LPDHEVKNFLCLTKPTVSIRVATKCVQYPAVAKYSFKFLIFLKLQLCQQNLQYYVNKISRFLKTT
jgi:hypothetical protein